MKTRYILSIVVMLFSLVACKQEAGNVQQEPTQTPAVEPTQAPATQESGTPQSEAPAGEASQATSGGHDYTFLTDKLFHYKGSFGVAKGSEDMYKDQWIDFASDGSYKAGKLKEQTHTGKWSYNHEVKVIQLRPDVNTFNRSEWKVMFNDQMMVWVGTQTFGNNATQLQLVRSNELP